MQFLHNLAAAIGLAIAALGAAELAPVNTPSPMLGPTIGNCVQFHLAGTGEDCNALIAAAQLSRAEFFRINPGVGGEEQCKNKIIAHTWYCVLAADTSAKDVHPPSPQQPVPSPQKTSSKFEKSENPGDKTSNPLGHGPPRKDEGKGQEPKPKTEQPKPTITKGPDTPRTCDFGSCWQSFAQLSFKGEQALRDASELCTKLFNTKCEDQNALQFPGAVNEGCANCDELSSGCPCFTGSKYHTYTNGAYFHPERFHPPPVFTNGV